MRCVCGYGPEFHEDSGHCPLCACGKLPAEHVFVTVTPACPGKPLTAAGKFPTLRRGSFRAPAPPERLREWSQGVCVPVVENEPETAVTGPLGAPQVPARYTAALDEIAPRAMPLGARAADSGWRVDPWYWRATDGTETSALVMQRDSLRAVAYWARPPGGSWKTAGAQAWRLGDYPQTVTVTKLAEYIGAVAA